MESGFAAGYNRVGTVFDLKADIVVLVIVSGDDHVAKQFLLVRRIRFRSRSAYFLRNSDSFFSRSS